MVFELFDRYFYFLTDQRQWDKLWDNIYDLIQNPYLMSGLGLILLTLVLGLCITKVRIEKKKFLLRINVLIYILGLVLIYLFRQPVAGSSIRDVSLEYYLVPQGYHESLVLTSIAHAFLYIPFGYWLTRGFKRHWLLRPLILVLVVLGVEVLQLILARGYLAIQDMIIDVVGSIIGAIPAGIVNIVEDRTERRRSS